MVRVAGAAKRVATAAQALVVTPQNQEVAEAAAVAGSVDRAETTAVLWCCARHNRCSQFQSRMRRRRSLVHRRHIIHPDDKGRHPRTLQVGATVALAVREVMAAEMETLVADTEKAA